jgi:hypothetical protein
MKQNIPDYEIVSMFQLYIASNDPSEIDRLEVEDLVTAEARLKVIGSESNCF